MVCGCVGAGCWVWWVGAGAGCGCVGVVGWCWVLGAGRVGMWACGCVGVWVCGCWVWVWWVGAGCCVGAGCGCVGMWVWAHQSVSCVSVGFKGLLRVARFTGGSNVPRSNAHASVSYTHLTLPTILLV
eukprot:2556185-Pyramimonas_sp.AAC.1